MAQEELAGYVLEERLAVGGMAEVFRGYRAGTGGFHKPVAIKRILPELAQDPSFVEMFLAEARLAAHLTSPNLVQVFDFGEERGAYYLVMELVDGSDLASLLAHRGALEIESAVFIARELCTALHDLHAACDADGRPLVLAHRDVTPANVLISERGVVKLGDFGIAKARTRAARTAAGTLKGKLAYLSPEQARGETVDARTDIYGVGLTLFEAVTGSRYLSADTEAELLDAARAPSFHWLVGLPPELEPVLRRCLEPTRERRFPDAAAVSAALARAIDLPEPAQCRQVLGRLVQAVQTAPSPTAHNHAPAAEPRTPPPGRSEENGHTEVLEPHAAKRTRPAFWGALLAATALLAIDSTLGEDTPSPAPIATVAAPAPFRATEPVAPLPSSPPPAPNQPDAPAAVVRQAREPATHTAAPPTTETTETTPPATVSPAVVAEPKESAIQLGDIEAALNKRGLLAADAPVLFGELHALRSESAPDAARVQALESSVRDFAIDRAFIDAKLQRVSRQVSTRNLDASTESAVHRAVQEVLSLAVTARYERANRELNEIVRILQE